MKNLTNAQLKVIERRLKDRNRRFCKLSTLDQRIKICRDVISQIKVRKLVPENLVYFVPKNIDILRGRYVDQQFNKVLATDNNSCRVCALGGIFVAALNNYDNLTVGEYKNRSYTFGVQGTLHKYLRRWFHTSQLVLIECAFELTRGGFTQSINFNRAVAFGLRYNDSESRLIAICKNIIANNGKFVP